MSSTLDTAQCLLGTQLQLGIQPSSSRTHGYGGGGIRVQDWRAEPRPSLASQGPGLAAGSSHLEGDLGGREAQGLCAGVLGGGGKALPAQGWRSSLASPAGQCHREGLCGQVPHSASFWGAAIEPWALHSLGKHSTAELYPNPQDTPRDLSSELAFPTKDGTPPFQAFEFPGLRCTCSAVHAAQKQPGT